MSKHLLKHINIEDYKCFNNFKAEGFARVNLIGGKNNVGKTAFMEAVFINLYSCDVNTLFTSVYGMTFTRKCLNLIGNILSKEKIIEYFENIKKYSSKSNIRHVKYQFFNQNGTKKYQFILDKDEQLINSNDFSYEFKQIKNLKFIDNLGLRDSDIKDCYIKVQKKDKEVSLDNYLNSFDSSIEKFKIFDESPECKLVGKDEYRPLNEFGDGLRHYVSIICALYASSDGTLFVDEIDNGIHYTQLDRLWEIILTLSKEQNVQVFATTHSKECIESYARVAKKLAEKDVTYSIMSRLKNGDLHHAIYDYSLIENSMEQELEIRGW